MIRPQPLVSDSSVIERLKPRTSEYFYRNDFVPAPLRLEPEEEDYKKKLGELVARMRDQLKIKGLFPRPKSVTTRPPQSLLGRATATPETPAAEVAGRISTDRSRTVLVQRTPGPKKVYDQITQFLYEEGYTVLPTVPYPYGGARFMAAFEADVMRSCMVVQLLGESPDTDDPDLPQGRTLYQAKVAGKAKVPLLQWRPADLDIRKIEDEAYAGIVDGGEVVKLGTQDLKGELLRRLKDLDRAQEAAAEREREAALAASGEPQMARDYFVLINAQDADDPTGLAILRAIEPFCSASLPPLSTTSESSQTVQDEALEVAHAVLIIYGRSHPEWVGAQIRNLKHKRANTQLEGAVCVGPPSPKEQLRETFERLRPMVCHDPQDPQSGAWHISPIVDSIKIWKRNHQQRHGER